MEARRDETASQLDAQHDSAARQGQATPTVRHWLSGGFEACFARGSKWAVVEYRIAVFGQQRSADPALQSVFA